MNLRLTLIILFLAISSLSFGQSLAYKTLLKGYYDKDFPVVYPDQEKILESAILLDTREKEEFEVSQLKGATWVGYETFSMESLKDIPKDETIVVYCSIGARSQDIGKKLKSAGYQEVYNLYGGIFHWVNEDNPVYNNEEETEEVHAFSRIWGIWLEKGKKVY
ncbi:rhodanese-like domain-containing protein [Aquiflexum lacus]|uniref:rhodanese-like domain-containing protein n=1 Tax=Aquiflexum lacus TaxID=2483805 RepID=UPI0018934F4B|nr:rhodanese-like domain-containing protein [Aquiflexum lacus]